jgi:ribonuclease P protein component
VSNSGLSYSFEKKLRLLKAADFQPVFKHAAYKVSSQTMLFLAIDNGLSFPRLGLVIAKKNISTAVHRNRVKRLLRESFRHNQHLLAGLDIVILARSGLGSLDNSLITRQTETLWKDLLDRRQKSRRKPSGASDNINVG